jgi:hypothetical protein
MDWERDGALVARIESLDWRQRYQTAVMALRRLRVPLLEFGMPAAWGVPVDLVRSLFVTLTAEPRDALADAVHTGVGALQMAPLLADREYVDPDLIQEVQLEAIGCLLTLNDGLMDLDVDSTEDIAYRVRAMSHYLDQCIDDARTPDPGEDAHALYLSQLREEIRVYEVGYFGSRNLELEFACHAAIVNQRSDERFFSSAAGRELVARGDEFSAEFVTSLRQFEYVDRADEHAPQERHPSERETASSRPLEVWPSWEEVEGARKRKRAPSPEGSSE